MNQPIEEIEALKYNSLNFGREIIEKMIKAHSSFDKKKSIRSKKECEKNKRKEVSTPNSAMCYRVDKALKALNGKGATK